jgi:hypothetical protein
MLSIENKGQSRILDLPKEIASAGEALVKVCRAPMFIAALFTTAKLWKQPRCPTTDEWIKKMWYLYTMEFYAAMKKNEMLSFADKLMELGNIILSEVSLAQKTKNLMFSLICGH